MPGVKALIDEYAAENQELKMRIEQLLAILRDVTVMHGDTKGEIRITQKIRDKASKHTIEVRPLKTSIVLRLKERKEE